LFESPLSFNDADSDDVTHAPISVLIIDHHSQVFSIFNRIALFNATGIPVTLNVRILLNTVSLKRLIPLPIAEEL
jgi:hypothetical protein